METRYRSRHPRTLRAHRLSADCGPAATIRLFDLHERLAAGRQVDAVSLAREFEVDPRTIKRDIDLLRDRRRAPLVWDAKRKSYRYTAPFDLASGLRLDSEEALAVVLAGRTRAAWGGESLGPQLTAALEKIARFAGPAISFPVADLHAVLHQDEAALDTPDHRHFANLLEHILARRELVVLYQKPSAARPERRVVRPLHLAYLDHRWMLIAEDAGRKAWRNFVLPRIRAIEPTARTFTPPPPARIKRHLAGSLGRFTGDREIEVRLRFTATAAPYLRERPWHASQKLTPLPDGGVEVVLTLNNLVDVSRRVLANGRHVEVLAPAELRASLAAEIAALAQIYAQEIATASADLVGLDMDPISAPTPPPKKSPGKFPEGHPVSHPAR